MTPPILISETGPYLSDSTLSRASFEAVEFTLGIDLGRCWLAKQPAQVEKMLLRGRAFLELGRSPLGYKIRSFHQPAFNPNQRTFAHIRDNRGVYVKAQPSQDP